MKRLIVLVVLAAIVLGMPLFGISDTSASVANNSVPDTVNVPNEAEHPGSNSSATATITITMTGNPNE